MNKAFKDFALKNKLFVPTDRVLLAVSGGLDSIVLTHLFAASGCKFAIAHCNFGLRGKESQEDELFVKDLAKKYSAPFYVKQFDTATFSKENDVSIQMAARDLRYAWFEEVRKKNKYKYIALAHHSDDVLETILINLTRGTGISGLHGIPVKRGAIIRPLLFATRNEIQSYAKENTLTFREDSSNAGDKYMRNKIRHHVIPVLKEINPSLNKSVENATENIRNAELILVREIKKASAKAVNSKKGRTELVISELKKLEPLQLYLYEFLKEFRFDSSVINDLSKNIAKLKTGTWFLSATHRLLVDRNKLIITPNGKSDTLSEYVVKKNVTTIKKPLSLKFKIQKWEALNTIAAKNTIATVDYAKLKFPIILRKWKEGDRFMPLGMKGFKKLSDFFVDNKMSMLDKENQWLLVSGDDIVWVVGRRIDDRYKISPQTGKVFVCELKDN